MNARTYRPIPLALTALIALFSALAALAFAGGHDAHGTRRGDASTRRVSQKEFALRSDMRKLWEDHVTWTRLAVISLVSGSPDTKATVTRLLRNQTDIGNAIKPFYGNAAGAALTKELRGAHPDRGRPDRRRQGRRPSQARRRAGPLARQRCRHRDAPEPAPIRTGSSPRSTQCSASTSG